MNLQRNKGQTLLEVVIALPLFLIIVFFLLEFSGLTIAQRIHQWACFRMARLLIPRESCILKAQLEVQSILQKIPFSKSPPITRWNVSEKEVTVHLSQIVHILGRNHAIKNTCTLVR